MFGIGFGEMVVIAVFLLIAVGPDKLPTMIKTVAKTYRQFRRTALDLRASTGIDDLLRDEELRELAELRKQKLLALSSAKPNQPVAAVKKPVSSPEATTAQAVQESREDEPPIAPVPVAKDSPPSDSPPSPAKRLSDAQRQMEAPPEGVDVAEAEWALGSTATTKFTGASKPTGEL